MQVELVRPEDLSEQQLRDWIRVQQSNLEFRSPYFRPEFTQAVAKVRSDVEVALLKRGGETFGFFPFQRSPRNTGKPVGGRLSDFHGVIADAEWSASELIDGCRLDAWNFDHLPVSQTPFSANCWSTAISPYIDLTEGFSEYRRQKKQSGSRELEQALRKARKVSREVGPLRLEVDVDDDEVFATLLQWKSDQYRRTKLTDVFAFDWTVALLEQLRRTNSDGFRGLLSAVFAGDKLLAVHFGMRSGDVFHYWFPAYDRTLMKYSPGVLLISELLQAAETLGIRRLDLGKGDEQFKTSFMTGATLLAEGSFERRFVSRIVRKGWHDARAWVRSSRLYGPAQVPAGWIRPLREWLAFR